MNDIVAISVTYNDAEYLKTCVQALLKQTVKVSHIIIVDNNSNQSNKSIIRELECPKVDILNLPSNLGGAGGFQKGMEFARDHYDPDWYWLMDADAYPREDCLENLMSAKDKCDNIGFLAPLIYGVDLQQYQLYHIKKLARYLERDLPVYSSYEEIPEISEIEADAFVGPLFSKQAVEQLGVADGSMFIYGDDLEYTYRVSRKFNCYLVKDAIINHRDQPAANGVQQPKNWWKDYYMYRNRFLIINEFQSDKFNRAIGINLTKARIIKQKILCIIQIKNRELQKIRLFILQKAIADGISNIRGKSVDPAKFCTKINAIMENPKCI